MKHSKAFSLIEILVATTLMSLLALASISIMEAQNRGQVTNDRISLASAAVRQFLDLRGKAFQAAWDEADPDLRKVSFSDFTDSADHTIVAGVADTYKKTLRVPNAACWGENFETLETECVAPVAGVDWASLPAQDLADLRKCAPQSDPQKPCPFDLVPRIKITQESPLPPAVANVRREQFFPNGNGSGSDGNPIGAAVCLSRNGDADTYNSINLKVLTIIRSGGNKLQVLRHEANYSRPKRLNSRSLPPKAAGCDKCASGRAQCP